jgi:iron complex outermembrane receptor protein
MRMAVIVAVIGSFIGLAGAAEISSAVRLPTNIPAQSLRPALQLLSKERNLQLIFRTDIVGDVRTASVSGDLTLDEALTQLLRGTGLTYRFLDDRTLTIIPIAAHTTPPQRRAADEGASIDRATNDQVGVLPRDSLGLARAGRGTAAEVAPVERSAQGSAEDSGQKNQLQEVVVNAQKKDERLQDVPVPVTVIQADLLAQQNLVRLQDYASLVPGLAATTDDYGAPQLAIRGMTMGGLSEGESTTAVLVDDVPYASSPYAEVPDLDPADLARVEVLRGPQGTLYGASSLGGLLKYVTIDPSTEAVSGRLSADLNGIQNGNQLGYGVRGAMNLPLGSTAALRASAFTRQDPGYVDSPVLGIKGVNKGEVYGGRLSALWLPAEDFSVKLCFLYQHSSVDGSPYVDVIPGLHDLQQDRVRDTGWYLQDVRAFTATLKGRVQGIDVTAVSGYTRINVTDSFDYTNALGSYTQKQFGVPGTPLIGYWDTARFTQEVRLSAPVGEWLEWLAGAFYDHEDSPGGEDMYGADPFTGQAVGLWLHHRGTTVRTEYAAFGDLTVHFTDRFEIQFGGRASRHQTQVSPETYIGAYDPVFLGLPSPVTYPGSESTDHSFTYLLTPQLRVSPDLMIYSRLASGYRPGGPNTTLFGPASGVPQSYKPDTTVSYEIGAKGSAFERLLSYDMSVYYIDWKDIQLQLTDPSTSFIYTANASRGKSQGVELSLESRPVGWLTLGGWVTWSDAELTADFPPTSIAYGVSGDRLPYSSRFSSSLSVNVEHSLGTGLVGYAGGSTTYVGERLGQFTGSADRQRFPAYARTDLHAGLRLQPWEVSLFVTNLADKRGLLNGGLGTYYPVAFSYIRPRSIGLSVERTF